MYAYIQAGGLADNVIRLGGWIDLEGGITVGAYGKGAFSYTPEEAVEPITWGLQIPHGPLPGTMWRTGRDAGEGAPILD